MRGEGRVIVRYGERERVRGEGRERVREEGRGRVREEGREMVREEGKKEGSRGYISEGEEHGNRFSVNIYDRDFLSKGIVGSYL